MTTPASPKELAAALREGSTVLYESFHHDAISAKMLEAAAYLDTLDRDADMRAFGASEAACYHYPGEDEAPLRAAYIRGAADCEPRPAPSPAVEAVEGWGDTNPRQWGRMPDFETTKGLLAALNKIAHGPHGVNGLLKVICHAAFRRIRKLARENEKLESPTPSASVMVPREATEEIICSVLAEVAAEIYLRAQVPHRDERMALKGCQHSIERVLEKHGFDPVDLTRVRDGEGSGPTLRSGDLSAEPSETGQGQPSPAPSLGAMPDRETIQILLDLLNPLHGELDRQVYDQKMPQNFDAPDDAEFNVNITARMERDLTQAVCILENRLRANSPSSASVIEEAAKVVDVEANFFRDAAACSGASAKEKRNVADILKGLERIASAVRSLAGDRVAKIVPDDVRRLVIAARKVAFEGGGREELKELDQASEEFADRVGWNDAPGPANKSDGGM